MNSLIISGARHYLKEIYQMLRENEPEMNVVYGGISHNTYGHGYSTTKVEKLIWDEVMTIEEKTNWINFGNKPLTRNKIRDIIDQAEYLYYSE